MGAHDLRYLIVPHDGDAVASGVNRRAFAYNVPLLPGAPSLPEKWRRALVSSGLWLQSCKISEDGSMLVLRLSEQDGRRLSLAFPRPVILLNMLEDREGETACLSVRPFEIVTVGVPLDGIGKEE